MEREFVASCVIVQDSKVLLIFHRKHQKWMPPGGHLEPNETPVEAVLREAFEETGLFVEIIPQENIWVEQSYCKSFERPYMCLLEDIPAVNGLPAHQHIDMIYLARPISGSQRENGAETAGIRWFSLEEIKELCPGEDIFHEVRELVLQIGKLLQ